jgi:hypothetical protein
MPFNPVTLTGSLIVAPAERPDIIVDFSAHAGQNIIQSAQNSGQPFFNRTKRMHRATISCQLSTVNGHLSSGLCKSLACEAPIDFGAGEVPEFPTARPACRAPNDN